MTRLASALAIVAAVVAPTSAFSPAFSTKLASRATTSLKYHPAKFERAVDCADTFGKCSIEEMLELSDGKSWYISKSFTALDVTGNFYANCTHFNILVHMLHYYNTELEDFQGCFYENGDEACEKEIDVSCDT